MIDEFDVMEFGDADEDRKQEMLEELPVLDLNEFASEGKEEK